MRSEGEGWVPRENRRDLKNLGEELQDGGWVGTRATEGQEWERGSGERLRGKLEAEGQV